MKIVDLHTHSNYSDGTFSPMEIIKCANKSNISSLALTDHDTVNGVEEAIYYGNKYGVEVISGVEISAMYDENELHIVGLFLDIYDVEFNKKLEIARNKRDERNFLMVEKLRENGIKIDYNNILKKSAGVITRANIAREIVECGYAKNNNECFERFIGKGKFGYVKPDLINVKDAINMINKNGGIAILAHPLIYKMSNKRLEMIVSEMAKDGLKGIEAYYSSYSQADINYVKLIAGKNGLVISGGSDFHGLNKPKISLGKGYGDLLVPYSVVEGLKKCYKNRRD